MKENQERPAPVLQFPENQEQAKPLENKVSFLTIFNLLTRRNLVFSTVGDLLSSLSGEKNKDKTLTLSDLVFICEYTLSNFAAMQVSLNRSQDTYFNIDPAKLGRDIIPNDMHDPIKKSIALFYNILKHSKIPKTVYESFETNEEEFRSGILFPVAKFMCDTYSHAMRATQAEGSLIDPVTIIPDAIGYLEDPEIIEFANTVSSMVASPFINNLIKEEADMKVLSDDIIVKYLLKIALVSHTCSSINTILKDVTSKTQDMGIMLNLIHCGTNVLSLLGTEDYTIREEISFEETYVELIAELANTFSMLFQPKPEEGKEIDPMFVPSKLVSDFYDTTKLIYNQMVQQANKVSEEKAEEKKIPEITEEDLQKMKDKSIQLIEKHIKEQTTKS
mgnify:CR=1 FL=1